MNCSHVPILCWWSVFNTLLVACRHHVAINRKVRNWTPKSAFWLSTPSPIISAGGFGNAFVMSQENQHPVVYNTPLFGWEAAYKPCQTWISYDIPLVGWWIHVNTLRFRNSMVPWSLFLTMHIPRMPSYERTAGSVRCLPRLVSQTCQTLEKGSGSDVGFFQLSLYH